MYRAFQITSLLEIPMFRGDSKRWEILVINEAFMQVQKMKW